LSAKASGTNHPAVLSLVSPDASAAAPAVTADEQNHTIFAAKVKTASGEMPTRLSSKASLNSKAITLRQS